MDEKKRASYAGLVESLYQIDIEVFSKHGMNLKVAPSECFLVMYCHVVPSFTALLERLIDLGFDPGSIHVIPKQYSKVDDSVKNCAALGAITHAMKSKRKLGHYDEYSILQLREIIKGIAFSSAKPVFRNSVKRAILVDDGGFLTRHWHRLGLHNQIETVSIQQTASGIFFSEEAIEIPKIDMARSAAKQKFESVIIGKGIVRKVSADDRVVGRRVGICGVGAIGQALASELRRTNPKSKISVFDRLPKHRDKVAKQLGVHACSSKRDLLNEADVIFGCTGKNWLDLNMAQDLPSKSALLCSCSSREVEFLSLLRNEPSEATIGFEDVSLTRFPNITVVNSGFPINFDRKKEWELPSEIAITRTLVLSAILQAACLNFDQPKYRFLSLAPAIQRKIVETWRDESLHSIQLPSLDDTIFENNQSAENWWQENSGGEFRVHHYM